MKRLSALAVAVALLAAPAFANPSTVEVAKPANPSDAAAAAAYVSDVRAAIDRVCRREAAPVAGPGVLEFRACVKSATADVIAQDRTGLLSPALGGNSSFQLSQR